MSLKTTIDADIKAALLGGDRFVADTLRGLKSVILNEEIAQKVRDTGLGDDVILSLVSKECKKRDEAAELFAKGGNQASAQKERDEKVILQRYLPQQLSDQELQSVVDAAVQELKPEGAKDMGRVIAHVKSQTGAAAEPAKIATLVKARLL